MNFPFCKGNHDNNSQGEFPDFYEFTLNMIFAIFLKLANPIRDIFVKNFENCIMGEFVKMQELTLVIILMISPENDHSRLKMKLFNFSESNMNYDLTSGNLDLTTITASYHAKN